MENFTRNDVELLLEEEAYQGFFQINCLSLRHRLFKGGWSAPVRRELFKRNDAVGVLIYDPQLDAVLLVEQFRIGVLGNADAVQRGQSPWIMELVAGIIDTDETPKDVGQRESVEEAGVDIQQMETIGEYFSSPGGSNEYFYLFAGKADLSHAGGIYGLENEGEDIRAHIIPVEGLWARLGRGEFTNAHTLIAVQWLKLNHQRLRALWLCE
jgi:ADP-ribose diphosphatase